MGTSTGTLAKVMCKSMEDRGVQRALEAKPLTLLAASSGFFFLTASLASAPRTNGGQPKDARLADLGVFDVPGLAETHRPPRCGEA